MIVRATSIAGLGWRATLPSLASFAVFGYIIQIQVKDKGILGGRCFYNPGNNSLAAAVDV